MLNQEPPERQTIPAQIYDLVGEADRKQTKIVHHMVLIGYKQVGELIFDMKKEKHPTFETQHITQHSINTLFDMLIDGQIAFMTPSGSVQIASINHPDRMILI